MSDIGFTGTQRGLTDKQAIAVGYLFSTWKPRSFHHGDCIGADSDAHILALELMPMARIVIHPPDNDSKRSGCLGDMILTPKPYLVRNHNIVDATTFLLATPGETEEQLRSGTWATIRYAKKVGKPVLIVFPSGDVQRLT